MSRIGICLAGIASLALLLRLPSASAAPLAPVELLWQRLPLAVELWVGRERTVFFPAAVRELRVPPALEELLRSQILRKVVHWLPSAAFAAQRVMVGTVDGQWYLIDLSASEGTGEERAPPLVIRDTSASPPQPRSGLPPAAALTRYAAQQLYAPERLRPRSPDIHPVPLARPSLLPPLVRGALLDYEILAAWRGYGLYVTALRVSNRDSWHMPLAPPRFDHARIRGHWHSSAFHHRNLAPAGAVGDRDQSVLYLVSRRPFEQSVGALAP